VFYEASGANPMYEIAFAEAKNMVKGSVGRKIVDIKEVIID